MDNEKRIGKSPFYDEYTGTTKKTKTYGYHVRKDFQKPLKEFLTARFGADASDNEIMEDIVQYYYFSFAHERTYYPKTLVALIHKDEINKPKPKIIPFFIADGFAENDNGDIAYDNETKEIRNMISMQFNAWIRRFEDADNGLKDSIVKRIFNDGYTLHKDKVFKMLNDADFSQDKFNDFIVLQIPLNNYLDVEQDGVYGFLKEDGFLKENQHCGLVFANVNSEIVGVDLFPITFNWRLNSDFSIDIIDICKLSQKDLAFLISRYNESLVFVAQPLIAFKTSLEFKLEENERTIEEFEFTLEKLKEDRLKILDAIDRADKQLE